MYFFKFFLESNEGTVFETMAPKIANVLNSIRIQTMNYAYTIIAVHLTEKENHQTDTGFENSLIVKIMMFQAVNSYTTFFYIAFLKNWIEGCDYGGYCMHDLLLSLSIIFGIQVLTNVFTEIIIPHYKAKWRRQQELKGTTGETLSQVELEYTLVPYDKMMLNIKDFSKLVIQFGYVTFFVTAFPGAPLMAWIENCIKIQVDGYKLMFEFQRAVPASKENIGIWYDVLGWFSKVAVVTNIALVTFTMRNFILDYGEFESDLAVKVWFFFLAQYFVFGIMKLINNYYENSPEMVKIQLARTEVIERKLINEMMHETRDSATSKTETFPQVSGFLDLENQKEDYTIPFFENPFDQEEDYPNPFKQNPFERRFSSLDDTN